MRIAIGKPKAWIIYPPAQDEMAYYVYWDHTEALDQAEYLREIYQLKHAPRVYPLYLTKKIKHEKSHPLRT